MPVGIILAMNFVLHSTFPQELKNDWNALLKESLLDVPFLRFEYLEQWWQTRGGGEWPQNARLVLISAHTENSLVGVAPLFLTELEGKTSLMFVGAIEISDFLCFIVRPTDLQPFLKGLFDFLNNNSEIPAWHVMDLHNLVEVPQLFESLQELASQFNWEYQCQQTYHSPYIPLPSDWEDYLSNLDKKQRHEIRRKMRRLEEAYPTAGLTFVEDANHLPAAIEDFFQLMAHDPQKEAFLSEAMRAAMRATISTALNHRYLQLAFLELDGKRAAAYLNFKYNDRLWVYNSGLDPQYYAVSAGWVLLAYLLRLSIEHGLPEFDFMRGNEDYKYRFGAVDRFVYHVRLFKN